MAASPGAEWGACRSCGGATAPGATVCAQCGAHDPLPSYRLASAPAPVRRRLRLTHGLRTLLVVAAVAGLGFTLVSAAFSGPPTVADPLTVTVTYTLEPGRYAVLSGEITGGDFVVGNYSSLQPAGASVGLAVYNSTEWERFTGSSPATSAWAVPPQPSGRIVYSAPYTDTFYFVFTNPYPAGSGLTVTVGVTTQYESNVGADGFA